MPGDYIPPRDVDFKIWSQNMSDRINADPAGFGVPALMAAQYQTLNDAYAAAFTAANGNITRTPSTITAKDDARRALESSARVIAAIVQAAPGVTAEQKQILGLTVRKTTKTRVAKPSSSPQLSVVSTHGHRVRLRLSESDPIVSRGKPAGVAGAAVFSFAGTLPPADESRWKYEGNATRLHFEVIAPTTLKPGATIWFRAAWFNRRGEYGPVCPATFTNLGFGMGPAMAA